MKSIAVFPAALFLVYSWVPAHGDPIHNSSVSIQSSVNSSALEPQRDFTSMGRATPASGITCTTVTCLHGSGTLSATGYVEPSELVELSPGDRNDPDLASSALPSISVAPEPSSLLLLGTGLLGSAAALYRRKRTATAA